MPWVAHTPDTIPVSPHVHLSNALRQCSALFSGLQALPRFDKFFPQLHDANVLGATTAAQFLPGIVVPFFASWMADKYDRKSNMVLGAIGVCIGAIVQATSHNLAQFIISRVIIGVASSMTQAINPTMLVEIAQYASLLLPGSSLTAF